MELSKEPGSSDSPSLGSIPDVTQRLLLWAGRSPSGLARVEYSSEFARQWVMQALKLSLAERSIPLHQLVLPTHQTPEALVAYLLQALSQFESGLVSISGFATAFSSQVALPDALRIVNFNRERFAAAPLRQIWWMTPAFLQVSIHAMPDLSSWFNPRLQLTEAVFAPDDSLEPALLSQSATGSIRTIEDAQERSHHLIRQFEQAKATGATSNELLTTYLLPALEALAEVGAQPQLHDLTTQFEGLLGQLQHTDSANLATSLNRLAALYDSQGRYGEAEPLYIRALQIREQQWGADHPHTAQSLNNVAGLYYSQGRYGEAEPLYRRALQIREQQLGADHPSTATSLNNLAELYRSQGRYGEAEPLVSRALQIREQQLGADHPDTAQSLNNLAGLYESQGRASEAEPLYTSALGILGKSLGDNHPRTQTVRRNLRYLVQHAVAAGQAGQLSEHPTTQAMLQELRSQGE